MTSAHDSLLAEPALLAGLAALGLPVYAKDAAGRYTQLNAAAAVLFGTTGPCVGRVDADLLPAGTAAALRAADQAALGRDEPTVTEHALDLGAGRREFTAVRVPLGGGALLGVWIERSEQTRLSAELQQALHQLEEQQRSNEALRSEVEGRTSADGAGPHHLVRGEQFEDHLRREIDLSLREHREFAVVYVQVDPTPASGVTPDEAGHELILGTLGRLLRDNTRAMDAPSRLSGERFAVLLSGVGLATAHARMEGLRRQCATQLVPQGGAALRFTVSMGVASFPHTSQTQAGLLQAAETALTQARARGGNHVALASIPFGSDTAAPV